MRNGMRIIEVPCMIDGEEMTFKETIYEGRAIQQVMEDLEVRAMHMETVTKRKRKRTVSYLPMVNAFDIETTTFYEEGNPPRAEGWMYHFQFCFDNDLVVFGKSWKEFVTLLDGLRKRLELGANRRLVIYVHNLAFEFQFMKEFIQIDEVFARDKGKPIWVVSDGIEFRCSWFLSNMNLKKFGENSPHCIHRKLDGEEYDYRKLRHGWTPVTQEEEAYDFNDVKGLCECIEDMLLMHGDTIASIPSTSTGYVRRDAKKWCRMKQFKDRHAELVARCNDYGEHPLAFYTLLKDAFRGGNTHANRAYAGMKLKNVRSRDEASAYPAVLLMDYFPVGKFRECVTESEEELDVKLREYCCVFRIRLFDAVIHPDVTVPYIPAEKCKLLNGQLEDNGRVLSAACLEMAVTEIDFEIIRSQYEWSAYDVYDFHYADRGSLPEPLRQCTLSYFRSKSELKGVPGKEYEYMKSKNKLNAMFGFMVTDMLSDLWEVEDEDGILVWQKEVVEGDEREELLKRTLTSKNTFLCYQWGVYVTAHARRRLERGIDICGKNLVYVDTDSCKYLAGDKDSVYAIENAFAALNAETEKQCMESGAYVDIPLKPRFLLGIFEDDGEYREFKTLGAKKYCYTDDNGFHITVAGMSKKKGAERIGCMDNFTLGQTFRDVGRSTSYYTDARPHMRTVTDYLGNRASFITASGIAIVDTTYTLGVTDTYYELIWKNIEGGMKL